MVTIVDPSVPVDTIVKDSSYMFQHDTTQASGSRDRSALVQDIVKRKIITAVPSANYTWNLRESPYLYLNNSTSVNMNAYSNAISGGVYYLIYVPSALTGTLTFNNSIFVLPHSQRLFPGSGNQHVFQFRNVSNQLVGTQIFDPGLFEYHTRGRLYNPATGNFEAVANNTEYWAPDQSKRYTNQTTDSTVYRQYFPSASSLTDHPVSGGTPFIIDGKMRVSFVNVFEVSGTVFYAATSLYTRFSTVGTSIRVEVSGGMTYGGGYIEYLKI